MSWKITGVVTGNGNRQWTRNNERSYTQIGRRQWRVHLIGLN